MGEFTMPSLGADMEAGTLQEWLVAPGDKVSRGDVIAVVETDKSSVEIECFESGTVGRLLISPGTRVPVGAPLALIEAAEAAKAGARAQVDEGTRAGAAARPVSGPPPGKQAKGRAPGRRKAPAHAQRPTARRPSEGVPPPATATASDPAVIHAEAGPLVRHLAGERGIDLSTVHGSGPGGRITRTDVERAATGGSRRVRATPYARRLARELHVDLGMLHGTGEDGAVRAADVKEAVHTRAAAPPTPAAPEALLPSKVPLGAETAPPASAAIRRAIGELMSRAKREIPHYYLATTIDMNAALAWLRAQNRELPVGKRMVPAALLLKAVAAAAREVPDINGFWQDGGFVPGHGVHLGFAVSLRDGGLAAPVIHNADSLTPLELMARLKNLVQGARRGRLRGSEITGSTLTVTSLGDQGVEVVYGVIHPPQVALVGFGAVVERPWADHGMVGVRSVVTATLSADHRATDGAVGARFLTTVDRLLQKPEDL
ncbi:dihydrolipoamide acetyltransferase family protein [Streptomyces sp. CA-106131]|uniref:dihydrolipoamide acetyltransferase family protein n=1 Tax=Streptomyces sp. CA-106131 TaxID=3240045 RepID=UPI003D8E96D9